MTINQLDEIVELRGKMQRASERIDRLRDISNVSMYYRDHLVQRAIDDLRDIVSALRNLGVDVQVSE